MFRERYRPRKAVFYIELIAMAISIAFPYIVKDIVVATIYSFLYPSILAILGLRKSSLYTLASYALLTLFLIPMAVVFHGDIENVYRFTLVALSTLSIGILILSTLHPTIFRNNIYLYLLAIMLNNTLKEVRDIATVFRAKGEQGLKLYTRIIITSIIVMFTKIETLIDSLKARGIEIE